jgi:hypothetical protein
VEHVLPWLRAHSTELQLIACGLVVIGIVVAAIGRLGPKTKTINQDRRVHVGRDNTGFINTGDVGQAAKSGSDRLARFASWCSIIGVVIGLISLIPVVEAWFSGPAK